MTKLMPTVANTALECLKAESPKEKIRLTQIGSQSWLSGNLLFKFDCKAPTRPGRPARPELLPPNEMPRRRNVKSLAARIAMLHAIAHIELNAIDLAWDIVLRFGANMPRDFTNDWIKVANDEARHFELLEQRLFELDSYYGALNAHDGLWQSAESTADDLSARLAIVPLVLEARGLDVTPGIIKKLNLAGDQASIKILNIIYCEEIDHVRIGAKWFTYQCEKKGLLVEKTYQKLVKKYFTGNLKPPFNIDARNQAGLSEGFYIPLVKSNNN